MYIFAMACFLGLGASLLLSHWAGLARGSEPLLSHGDAEMAQITSGLGLCGLVPSGPLERTSPTCPHTLVEGFGTEPSGWHPWTHRPYCADTPYCVFTNAHFHGDRGVSLITTPETAASTLDSLESIFTLPFQGVRPGSEGPSYEVREIPGKGMGAVALRPMRRGERFMIDYASVIADVAFPTNLKMGDGRKLLEAAVDQLPRRGEIRDLAQNTNTTTRVVEDLVRTNSFGMTVDERSVMVLFPEISRMNHACTPNVFTRFSENSFAMTAMATRDIEQGEELSISYSELGMTRPERQDLLRKRWGFTCTCSLCAASAEDIAASDARREGMRTTRERIVAHVNKREFSQAASWHVKMVDMIREEGMMAPLGEHYEIIARLHMATGDWRETVRWAKLAIEDLEVYGGREVYGQVWELEEFVRRAEKKAAKTK